MTITARFAGTCDKCGQRFSAGSKIEWSKGQPAQHISCDIATVKTPSIARPCRRCGTYCYGDCAASNY